MESTHPRRWLRWLTSLLGLLLFVVIASRADWPAIFAELRSIRVGFLLLPLLLSLPLFMLKATRWRYLAKQQGIEFGFVPAFLAFWGSYALSIVTPGRVGDFVKVAYLRSAGVSTVGKSLASVLVDRLIDVIGLALVATLGLLVVASDGRITLTTAGFVLFIMLILALLLSRPFLTRLSNIVGKIPLPPALREGIIFQTGELIEGLESIANWRFIYPVTLTLVSYVVFFTMCYGIALALDLPGSPLFPGFVAAATSVASVLLITVSGFGTREAVSLYLFGLVGLSAEQALSFSILQFLILNVCLGLVGGLVWWRFPPGAMIAEQLTVGEPEQPSPLDSKTVGVTAAEPQEMSEDQQG